MIPGYCKVYDRSGAERDPAWLQAHYGAVSVSSAAAGAGAVVFRIVEIREKTGHAALVAKVINAEGQPMAGVPVIRYWPDAPSLPTWDPPPERWKDRGVVGKTSQSDGDIGFGMGKGDYYDPGAGQVGASAIWLGKPATHSDLVEGLGMLKATNHDHVDLTFQLSEGSPGPGPGPGPTPGGFWAEVAAAVAEVAAGLDRLGRALGGLDSGA